MSHQAQYLSIVSGQSRGVASALARTGLAILEPAYRGIIRTRNTLYNQRVKASHDLGRFTVSVGNLTTGGTGKTPVVQWLADQAVSRRMRPAILMRGYGSKEGFSDEAELLRRPGVVVQINPDRIAGAKAVLSHDPSVDLFLLDDGFQHRRARRDVDLVLIDATCPFGYGHVLPRGLLREPIASLSRAHAILITRADAINDVSDIKRQIRMHAPTAPILCSRHVIGGLVDANGSVVDLSRTGRCLILAGIGNPSAFAETLSAMGVRVVDQWSPGDHHVYTDMDVQRLIGWKNIDSIITTEKDWVKLRRLPGIEKLSNLSRAILSIDFADGDADRLLELTIGKLKK